MSDWREPFLAAIREDPSNDAIRLTFADYLEERGECELAEFIRVGCELARLQNELMSDEDCNDPNCEGCAEATALRNRERKLLANSLGLWCVWPGCPVMAHVLELGADNSSKVPQLMYRRGFVAVVRCTSATLLGRECERCEGRGEFTVSGGGRNRGQSWVIKCDSCKGKKRFPGIAAALGRLPGLERVELSDKNPADGVRSPESENWDWFGWYYQRDDIECVEDELPMQIYSMLSGYKDSDSHGWARYPSASAAHDALAVAAAQWCRIASAEANKREGVTV